MYNNNIIPNFNSSALYIQHSVLHATCKPLVSHSLLELKSFDVVANSSQLHIEKFVGSRLV